ncbi:MAG: rhodanese-like domain-containing protein [Desulfuromonadales bacterium]
MRCGWYSILAIVMVGGVMSGCSRDIPREKRAVNDLRVPAETVQSWLDEGRDVLFIDLRSEPEWEASSRQIPGALRVQSYLGVEDLVQTLDKDRCVVTYCTSLNEGTSAGLALMLRDKGFECSYALLGGWDAWVQGGYPVAEKTSPQ